MAATVVVPCFNEARRLDLAAFADLLDGPDDLRLLFVNDGSTDDTLTALKDFAATSAAVDVLALATNQGKAEAVRRGLLAALEQGATIVAYYDADLSTPPPELARLVATLREHPELQVVLASRVRLLGRNIDRYPHRHYLGRVFATFASLTLDIPVYDTQCGAKALQATPALRGALAHPFTSSWVLDVELLGRLLYPEGATDPVPLDAVLEMPLTAWRDVGGSKLDARGMVRAALDLARVARALRRRPSFAQVRAARAAADSADRLSRRG